MARRDMADFDEFNKVEGHTADMAAAKSLTLPTPPERTWAPFRSFAFGDPQRMENNLFTIYESAGGSGLPTDSDNVATVRLYTSEWQAIPEGFKQTVLCPIAVPNMNGVASFSTWLNTEGARQGRNSTPFISDVGAGTITVTIYGTKPIRDINIEVHKRVAVIRILTLQVAGWVQQTDSTYTQTVSVAGVTATSEGIVGYQQTISKDAFIDGQMAKIRASGQGEGTVTFNAVVKPTLPIPVEIQITDIEV